MPFCSSNTMVHKLTLLLFLCCAGLRVAQGTTTKTFGNALQGKPADVLTKSLQDNAATKVIPVICNGTCDVSSCDFVGDLCLNRIDFAGGNFDRRTGESCAPDTWGVLFEILLFLYAMLGLAIVCDDHLCVALERLCDELMIREDVAGATFMAFGSAAPEIIVNTVGTVKQVRSFPPTPSALDATNLGVGAILGSGMIAFLIIPGACALSTGDGIELLLKRRPLLRDVSAYAMALLLLCIFFHDGVIMPYEAGILVGFYALYVSVVIFAPKVREEYRHRILKRPKKKRKSFVNKKSNAGQAPLLSLDERTQDFGSVDDTAVAIEPSDDSTRKTVSFADNVTASSINGAPGADAVEGNYDVNLIDDEDGSTSAFGRLIEFVARPLTFMFEWTCVNCEEGSKYQHYYPLTFLVSFIWVAMFSMVISSCVARWTEFTPPWAKGSFFGLITIAIGAEIPDTIQSVTMAKRGYGSMAVSNALGSQIINILLGLGLPWLIANLAMKEGHLQVTDHSDLQFAAFFQFGAVALNLLLLLGMALYWGQNKATLTIGKGKLFIAAYAVVVGSYVLLMLTKVHKDPCKE